MEKNIGQFLISLETKSKLELLEILKVTCKHLEEQISKDETISQRTIPPVRPPKPPKSTAG